MTPTRRLLSAAAAAIVWAAAAAGPPSALAQRFGEATEVVSIEIPVQVVRDGEPVRGLTAADFEVYEGRRKQAVSGFDVVDLAAPAAPAARTAAALPTLPIAARRHFLLLFDFSFAEPKSLLRARQVASELVLKALNPSDLVAVATYSTAQGPQLVLGFTSDRRQIDAALATLGTSKKNARARDPLRLVVAETNPANGAAPGQGQPLTDAVTEGHGTGEEALLTDFTLMATSSDRANRTDLANRITALSRSMSDLAKLMGSVEGRKQVVYLSEGFDSSLLTGSTDAAEVDDMNAATLDQPYLVESEKRYGSTRTLNVLGKMFEEFRRADCVVQAVDIGGLRGQGDLGGKRTSGQDGLLLMAKETGGELYQNFNDLGAAMGQMLKRTSVTYLLSIQPEKLKADGAFHRLNVELKNAPRGTRVVFRPGYYAPKPYAQRNPLERLLDVGSTIVSGEQGGAIQSAVLAAAFRVNSTAGAGDLAYVPLLIEIDGPGLLADQQGDTLPAEIYAYAIDSGGAVRDFFTQTLGLDLAKVGPTLRKSGLKFFGHLDLPAGDYSLRILVRNGKTGAYSLRAVALTVPAYAAAGPVLLPPFFPEPAGRWLLAREVQRGKPQDVPYPFLLQQEPYIPASRPVLGPGQDARLSLVAYNLGEGEVQADAKIVGGDGKELPSGDLTLGDRERGSSSLPDRWTATFRPPALPPGEYQLRVTLTGALGAAQTSSTAFVVAGAKANGR